MSDNQGLLKINQELEEKIDGLFMEIDELKDDLETAEDEINNWRDRYIELHEFIEDQHRSIKRALDI